MTPELCVALLESIGGQEGLIRDSYARDGQGCALGSLELFKGGHMGTMYDRMEYLDPEWHRDNRNVLAHHPVSEANDDFLGAPEKRKIHMLGWIQRELDDLLKKMEADAKLCRWSPPMREIVPQKEGVLA